MYELYCVRGEYLGNLYAMLFAPPMNIFMHT